MKKTIMILCAIVLLSGCAKQTFYIDKGQSYAYDPKADEINHFILGGLGQERTIYAQSICGERSNVTRVSTRATFGDIIIGIFTLGILTPRHAEVYCRRHK